MIDFDLKQYLLRLVLTGHSHSPVRGMLTVVLATYTEKILKANTCANRTYGKQRIYNKGNRTKRKIFTFPSPGHSLITSACTFPIFFFKYVKYILINCYCFRHAC